MSDRRRKLHPSQTGVIYIRSISRHVKDQFKAYCARRGSTMAAEVEKFMRECVRRDNESDIPRKAFSFKD